MSDTFKSWIVANLEIVFIPILLLIPFIGIPIRELGSSSIMIIIVVSIALIIISVLSIKRGIIGFFTALFLIFMARGIWKNSSEDGISSTPTTTDFDIIWSTLSQHSVVILVAAIVAIIGGIFIAIYAYNNFDEVVSRRFLYRNSNVSVFEQAWKYAFNRLFAGFMLFFGWFIELLLVCAIPV